MSDFLADKDQADCFSSMLTLRLLSDLNLKLQLPHYMQFFKKIYYNFVNT